MRFTRFTWIPITLALTACAAFQREKTDPEEEKTSQERPELVGRIASVPPDRRFVLIQSYGTWIIESGTILTTRGLDERTANLLVTGEKLGHFAAADIQSGTVEIGDAVYSRHVPNPVESAPEPETESELPVNQDVEGVENVQKNN